MAASRARGARGNANNNREIVALRAERTALLGFASPAALTADETAGTPEAVERMLRQLDAPAAHNATAEQAKRQLNDETEAEPFVLEARLGVLHGETAYRAVRHRRRSAATVVRGGASAARGRVRRLYGVTFTERHDFRSVAPTPGRSRCSRRTARRSASTPATANAAAPG